MKEQYVKMRNKNKFDINWFYSYYLEKGGKAEFNAFMMLFKLDNQILANIDREYGLNVLEDKDGNFIKVVE